MYGHAQYHRTVIRSPIEQVQRKTSGTACDCQVKNPSIFNFGPLTESKNIDK